MGVLIIINVAIIIIYTNEETSCEMNADHAEKRLVESRLMYVKRLLASPTFMTCPFRFMCP